MGRYSVPSWYGTQYRYVSEIDTVPRRFSGGTTRKTAVFSPFRFPWPHSSLRGVEYGTERASAV